MTIYPQTQNKISVQIHMASLAVMFATYAKGRRWCNQVCLFVCPQDYSLLWMAVFDEIVYNHFGCKK